MPKSTKEHESPQEHEEPATDETHELVGEHEVTEHGTPGAADTDAIDTGTIDTDTTDTETVATGATGAEKAATSARRRRRGGGSGGAASAETASRKADRTTRRERKRANRDAAASGEAIGDTAVAAEPSGGRSGLSASRLTRVITALLVVAILLAVILLVQLIKGPGSGGKLGAREDRGEAARQAASTEIPKLYSYDYRQIDRNIAEQQQLTVGSINDQIRNQTAPALKQLAPKAKAVVQAVSLDSAVLDATGPDVQVLVYLNQAVSSNLLPAPRLDRNRVIATMRLVDGQWKVADIKAL